MDRALVVGTLGATPGLLREMTRDATAAQAWAPPAPGEWSIAEVVRHLARGERDTFVPRLRRMLAETRPVFAATPSRDDPRDLAALLDAFGAARADAVAILAALDDDGWRREGVSPSRGALSVDAYARTMAEHDLEHLRQIHDVRNALGLLPKRCEARVALPLAELVPALGATPARLAEAAAGVDASVLRRRPAPGEWCANEVMAHLLDVETGLFLPRLARIATEDRPAFEPFSPEPWARARDRSLEPFAASLDAFRRARGATIAFLERLPAAAAERVGLSAHFGPVTLGTFATHGADHDLEHLAQIRACLAPPAPPPPATLRVRAALDALGLGHEIVDLGVTARTASDAARAVGCEVGQIVKSLVFRLEPSGRALLVLTSGANRVDETTIAAHCGETPAKADADFVRAETGFAIGGVAPVGHARAVATLIDEDLLRWPALWAAAGHPNAVFRLTPAELVRMTAGRVVAVK